MSNINGNSIFLPAAGGRGEDGLSGAGDYGRYYSSSLYQNYVSFAWNVKFDSGSVVRDYGVRYIGHSVRPVL